MRRFSLTCALVVLICLVFASVAAAQETKLIRVWIRGVNDVATRMINEEVIPAFEKLHPGVKVEFRPLTFQNNYIEIDTAIAAGDPPDIMTLGRPTALKYDDAGALLDITDWVKSWDRYDDFMPFVWRDSTNLQGRIVSVPIWIDLKAFIYHKRIFEESGLDPNNPPDNWEELEEAAVRLTKRDGAGNLIQSGWELAWQDWTGIEQRYDPLIWQNGGSFLDPVTWKKAAFDQPEGIEALEFLVRLGKDHRVDNFTPWGEVTRSRQWLNGQYAMTMQGTYLLQEIHRDIPDRVHEVGIALPPKQKVRATYASGTDLAISSKSKHPEIAWEFIKFLMTESNYLVRLDQEIGWQLPPLKSAREDFVRLLPGTEVLYDTLAYGMSHEPIPENLDMRLRVVQAIEEAMFGLKTPARALQDAARDVNRLLERATWVKEF